MLIYVVGWLYFLGLVGLSLFGGYWWCWLVLVGVVFGCLVFAVLFGWCAAVWFVEIFVSAVPSFVCFMLVFAGIVCFCCLTGYAGWLGCLCLICWFCFYVYCAWFVFAWRMILVGFLLCFGLGCVDGLVCVLLLLVWLLGCPLLGAVAGLI